MKKIVLLLIAVMLMAPVYAQNKKTTNPKATKSKAKTELKKSEKNETLPKVYDEDRDSREVFQEGLEESRATDRMLICQVGGNWCPWCLRLANMVNTDEELLKLVKENFVYVHINVPADKEKRDYELLKLLGNPGRFGYPALVIVDKDERVIHIQNTSYLEVGETYDKKKVMEFFQQWTRKAIEDIK